MVALRLRLLWSANRAPSTVRQLARDPRVSPRVLIGWQLPLGFGLDGRLLLARRGRVYGLCLIHHHHCGQLQGGFEISNGHTEIGIPNTNPQPRKKVNR